jgi:predicted DNA-binding ribbon-helix-helix protein
MVAFLGATPNEDPDRRSALVMRNISVHGRRTSIRLEPEMWDGLAEICRREYCSTQDVCSYVADHRHGSLASSLRVFILGYFHTSSTEAGHRNAGHCQGMFLCQQQERWEMRAMKAVRREPSAVAPRAIADGSDELQPSSQGPGRLDR